MPKRRNIICVMRRPLFPIKDGNGVVLRNHMDDTVYIGWSQRGEETVTYLTGLTSSDARLLARRINQFLDGGG